MKIEIIELQHIALQVKHVEESIAFYKDILRLEQLPRPAFNFLGAWFRLGNHQELHLIEGRVKDVESSNHSNHFALKVADIIHTEQFLQLKNIPMMGPKKRPDGAWQIFIKDIDGHTIEFFQEEDGGKQ